MQTTIQALLKRARCRMVQTLLNEGAMMDPAGVYAHWRGFASCAASLLDGYAATVALHDAESDPQRGLETAFARLPIDLERLTLADMKRLISASGVDFASDLIPRPNVNAGLQFQDDMIPVVKPDDKHAVAPVDPNNGSVLHGNPVADPGAAIVAQGGAQ